MASHEDDLHEEEIRPTLVDEELGDFNLSSQFSDSSTFDLEDNKSIFLDHVHTSLDDGALFDQLDVLKARS